MQQCGGERQALLQAKGQFAGDARGGLGQIEAGECRIDGVCLRGAAKTVDAREEPEVLPHRQFRVERETLRHVADARACLGGRAQQVGAGDACLAAGGAQQAAQHPEDGRFAGTIRPEQAEDLAAGGPRS